MYHLQNLNKNFDIYVLLDSQNEALKIAKAQVIGRVKAKVNQ